MALHFVRSIGVFSGKERGKVEMVGQAATLRVNKHELPIFENQSEILHSVQNDPRQKNK